MKKTLLTWLIAILISISGYSQENITVTIGGETPTVTNQYVPMYTYFNNSYSQTVYLADEIGAGGTISAISYYLSSHSSSSPGKIIPIKIYMAASDETLINANNYLESTDPSFKLVYDGNFDFGTDVGWKQITLDSSFTLPIGKNLIIGFEAYMGSYFGSPFWGTYTTTNQSGCSYSDQSMLSYINSSVSSSPAVKISMVSSGETFCYAVKNVQDSVLDAENVTVWWNESEETTGYQYQLKTSKGTWDETITDVNDTTVELTGLTPNTTYNFRVRNVCSSDSYSAWRSITFKTACALMTENDLPYELNIADEETGTGMLPSCWTRLNTTNTNYPSLKSSGLYFYYNNSVAMNGYTGDISALQLSFLAYPGGTSASYGTIEVGIQTDLTNDSTFTSIMTINATDLNSTWNQIEVPFTDYEISDDVETYYVVIKHTENGGGWYWYLKDIVLDYTPDCLHATNLKLAAITSETATLTWSAADDVMDFSIYYWLEDNPTDTLSVENITDTTVELTNLSAQEYYDFYIVTNCGDKSPKTMTYSFLTKCAAVVVTGQNPFIANFSNDVDMSCWEADSWYTSSYDGFIYTDYEGDLTLPLLNIDDVPTPYLKVTHQNENCTLDVYYRVSGNDWTKLVTLDKAIDSVTDIVALPEPSTLYEIKITNTEEESSYIYYISVYHEENPPACDKAKNVSATVSPTTATITWSQPGDEAASWILYYKTSDEATYTATEDLIDTTYTLTVTPQTTYNVYVITACGDNENNYPASNILTFTTPCTGLLLTDLPKTWDFDSNNVTMGTGYDTYLFPECWQRITTGNNYPVVNSWDPYSGDYSMNFYGIYNGLYAILPYVDNTSVALNELQVSLYAKNAYDYYDATVTVGIMTNPSDKSTFTAIDSVEITTSFAMYEFSLASYTGEGGYIAIRLTGDSYADVYVDDVTLQKAPDCIKPQGVVASNLTTTSATITWSQGGTVSAWNLYYKEESADTYTKVESLTEMTYDLSSLTNSTNYNVYVEAICTDTLLATNPITFQTLCDPLTLADLPYTMDFEDAPSYSLPLCWVAAPAYSSYPQVYNYSGYAYEGSKSLVFEHNCGVALKAYQGDVSQLQLSFFAAPGYNSVSYGSIEVGVQTDLSDETTYQSVQAFNASTWEDDGYAKLIVPLDTIEADENTTYYVIIKHNEPYNNGSPWYIDNVTLEVKPACAEVTKVAVSNITAETVTVTWHQPDESDSWTVFYKTDDEQDYQSADATDTTITLTGLTPQTNYTLYVQTNCTGDQPSSTPITFRTGCPDDGITITNEAPYEQDFEGEAGDFPDCWLKLNTSTSYTTGYYTTLSPSGYSCLYIKATGDANQPIVILPKFTNNISTLRISFYTKAESTSYSGALELGYLTDVNNASTFVVLDTVPMIQGSWEQYNKDLDEYADQLTDVENARLALRQNTTLSSSWYYYGVDNMVVSIIPACKEATNLAVNNITSDGATISWKQSGETVTSWTVKYREKDATDWEEETSINADTTANLTGLAPATEYEVYIEGECSDAEGTNPSSATITFTTACTAFTITSDETYTQDFENAALEADVPNCWFKVVETALTQLSGIGGYAANTGEYSLVLKASSSCKQPMIALPEFTNDLTELRVKFYAKAENTTASGDLELGYITDINDASTFVVLKTIPPTSTLWTEYKVDLNAYASLLTGVTSARLAFRHNDINLPSSWYYYAVDDLQVILTPACQEPSNITVDSITAESATITWSSNASTFNVTITEDGNTVATETNLNSHTYTATNLNSSTTYKVYVESVCDDGSTTESDSATFTTDCGSIVVTNTSAWDANLSAISCWTKDNTSYWYTNGTALAHGYGLDGPDPDDIYTPIVDISNVTTPALALTYTLMDYQGSGIANTLTILYRADTTSDWTELKSYNTLVEDAVDTIALPSKSATYQINVRWSNYNIDADGVEISSFIIFNNSTDTTTPAAPCDAPTSLTASNISQTSATITWVGTASSYDVQLNNGDIDAVTTTTKQLTGLTANTTYTVKVRSNCGTTTSDWVTTTFTTLEDAPAPCNTPTNLEVVATSNSLTLSWNGTAAKYDVQLNDGEIQTVEQTIYTFANLTPSTTYNLKVRSNCTETVSDWASITGTTNAEATGDQDPVVTTTSATATETTATLNAVVSVNNNTITESGFKYRQMGNTDWINVTAEIEASGIMSADIDGLTAQTTYEYKAYATTDKGTFEGVVKTFETQPSGLTDAENSMNVLTYPNPTTTDATLEIKGLTEDANVFVMDVNGKVVYRTIYTANQPSIKISTSDLSAGVYYIKVTNSVMTKTQTLIKQ